VTTAQPLDPLPRLRERALARAARREGALLFLAQRASAAVLAFAVAVHLATIIYAVRGGLTAAEVLGRTQRNGWFLAFYIVFVCAVAIHAPIGLRNIAGEWTHWRGRSLDVALLVLAIVLLLAGLTAALALYVP
jgi:succinate dehydrogenase subunit C